MTEKKSKILPYLLWTFLIAWMLEGAAAWLFYHVSPQAGQLMMIALMFAPFAGVLLSRAGLKDMGWAPKRKGCVSAWVVAWLSPILLTALGALLYFAVFPSHFDLTGEYIRAAAGDDAIAQLEAQGLTYPLYLAINVASSLLYAPVINTFVALGEEVGWRGFLYPRLKEKLGYVKGLLLGGVIWGVWHWPLIWLIGYEYGTGYPGFPVVGMLLFCLFTIPIGILADWVYEKSHCIWVPSLLHGCINAVATIPPILCVVSRPSYMSLLGPVPNGLLAGLPLILFAVLMLLLGKRGK